MHADSAAKRVQRAVLTYATSRRGSLVCLVVGVALLWVTLALLRPVCMHPAHPSACCCWCCLLHELEVL